MTTASEVSESEKINDLPPEEAVPQTPKTNGQAIENGNEEGPPTKRRRVNESNSIPKRKPESPPWKKVLAEGPSSFTVDGKRKSGRVNAIPLELQPPSEKRQTRGAAQKTFTPKGKYGSTNGTYSSPASRDTPTATATNGFKKSSGQNSSKMANKSATSPKRSHRKSTTSEQNTASARPTSKRSHAAKEVLSTPIASRSRRSGRISEITQDEPVESPLVKNESLVDHSPKATLSRIKLRVKPAVIPLTHPSLVIPPPKYDSFRDFYEKAQQIPVEQGGLQSIEDEVEYTAEDVKRDANIILASEGQSGPDGVLKGEEPPKEWEPAKQWFHQDHLTRAATRFRKLMFDEKNAHRKLAAKVAEACREEWLRRQPKSSEQLEAEERKATELRYRNVLKTFMGTWDNVKAEVNRQRLVEWEAQEQARVRKALNEAVDISTQKLQARRAQQDSDIETDEDEDEDEDNMSDDESPDAESNDNESNMSSSEDEADEETTKQDAEDENLTVDQLREKYATLPELPHASDDEMAGNGIGDSEINSDPSTDMDDDMGSSDEGENSEDEEEEDDDEEEDGEAHDAGILGFLTSSDVKELETKQAALGPDEMDIDVDQSAVDTPANEGMEVDEQDEVSLIPNGDPAQSKVNGVSEKQPLIEEVMDDDPQNAVATSKSPLLSHQTREVMAISPDRSSQPTSRTTETKQSEADSASSVDPNQSSRQLTESATPQPSNHLKTPVPFLLRGTLREYQHYGLDWLAGLYANNTNGILADEMGLGKTIQTIALLAHLACEHEVWGPHLVIVPTSVMLNWEMEFKKWCPGFKILTYYGTQEERKRKRMGWKDNDAWNVCITSYQLVLQDQQVFKRRQWHYMILDEAHNIKNFQSQRWQTMLNFNTRARLLLTGTPLQNNLTELWSLLYFLMPSDGSDQGVGGFANLKEFQDWFKKPSEQILEHGREQMDDESRAIISKLHKVLRPYLLRRLKADVEKQMPAKYEHVEFCRLSKRQRELYDSFLSRSDTRDTLASGNYLSIINCLMQLRKVCNHPDLFLDRPIMTSFPMEKSVITDFEIKDLLVRRKMFREQPMSKVSLEFLNLVPAKHESLSRILSTRISMLSAQRVLMDLREAQRTRAQNAFTTLDPSTVKSNLVYLESASRWGRFEELQHCVYLNALRRQQKPIYGSSLMELLDLRLDQRPLQAKPRRRANLIAWLEDSSPLLKELVPTYTSRSQALHTTIQKFACVTPPVVARDMTSLMFTPQGVSEIQSAVNRKETDPFHEARMRLSIQFPDKRLLQYDCGKLQTLDKLLRKLQAGGHRALIFTQMTKVLDILEQFLNIHGHKYLRLDGATKIEQRQILTDRFNNDTRILAFILSSRSGGLGINLTGADTVIFYDLDWNPAMDKQCQDRCHRIGQTRDVHIYRLVSEHTIEANILRKANQKRMLDDVVIQEGEFTTDYFNKMNIREAIEEDTSLMDGAAAANAAMDRVLGGPDNDKNVQRVLAQAEDREDVAAAKVAEREVVQTDAADFDENAATASATPAGVGTPRDGAPTPGADGTPAVDDAMDVDEDEMNAWGQRVGSIDDYMLKFMSVQLENAPIELPKDKKKGKKGRDPRHRSHRAR